jgi:hypothetical protein
MLPSRRHSQAILSEIPEIPDLNLKLPAVLQLWRLSLLPLYPEVSYHLTIDERMKWGKAMARTCEFSMVEVPKAKRPMGAR